MTSQTHLVVKESENLSKIVYIERILFDIPTCLVTKVTNLECAKLSEQYPANKYEIERDFRGKFSENSLEAQYLKENSPEEVLASEVLKKSKK